MDSSFGALGKIVKAIVLRFAPFVFVLLWSTGYIGAKFGLPFIEPFTFLAIRLSIAMVLLAVLATVLQQRWLQGLEWQHASVAGLLLHAGYLGGVFTGIKLGVPAGLSAIIVNLQPVLTSSVAAFLLREKVSSRQWLGLGLGFVGVALAILEKSSNLLGQTIAFGGVVAAFVALFSSTAGTIYQKKFAQGIPLLTGTAVQYAASSLVFVMAAFAFEQRRIVWNATLLWTMLWFILVISLGAILLLLWLIRHNSATQVSSLFYLVPPFTAIEAYVLFGEQLGVLAILGLFLTMIGVALVVTERKL